MHAHELNTEAVRRIVRAYLLEQPEVLDEDIRVLRAKCDREKRAKAKAAIGEHRAALVAHRLSPVSGNPDGKVTRVEFFDYQCGYCKRSLGPVMELLESEGGPRIERRELPVLGPVSRYAACVAMAAHKQAKAAFRIGSNALVLNGGTIRDTDSRDAQLTHAGVGRQGGHRVDGREIVGPAELSLFHIRTIDGGTILPSSPNFDPETTAYTASVPYGTRWIRVRALEEEGGERIILPADVEPNTEWHEVALGVGPNEITVTASRTGVPDRVYTMTVTRGKPTVTIAAAESSTTYRLEDLSFTVTRNRTIDEALDVNVAFEQDQDFLPASGLLHTVSIPANETSATLTLEAGDFTGGATANGTLTAAIAESGGYKIGALDSASVDFVVADPALTVGFDNTAYVFLEDTGAVTLDIVAETVPGVVMSDAFSLSVLTLGDQDSAVNGSDYIPGSGGVTFRAADFVASTGALAATGSIDLTVLDDSATEGEESFWIQLLATDFPPAATVVQGDGTDCPSGGCRWKMTIVDDESPPPQVTLEHRIGVRMTARW